MATSPALAWSLANGISQQQFDKNIVNAIKQGEAQGLSDAQFESLMNQYQISAADVARATQSTPAIIQSRMEAATPTTATEIAYNKAAMDELAKREAQWAEQQKTNTTNWAAQQKANELAWAEQQRLNALKNAQQIAANEAAWKKQQELNVIKNQQQIAANEAAWAAKQRQNEVDWAKQQAQVGPLANATGGFEQNFRNYQSIAPGAQYDPSVTGGMSPYGQIMGQMKPLGNPYANVQGGMPLGGYNPGLYDQIAEANTAKTEAANNPVNTTAQELAQSQLGLEQSSTGGMAQGGMVHGGLMFGMNPPGPDDGAVNLDLGEYVIKKSSVNKYGRGLLDMINEGKVPAKKLKSLLG
jgi:hypothetical protein